MTREELLDRIRSTKDELDDVLARISDDAMVAPHPTGEWSGKDQLSHLAAWHEILLARMRGVREEDMLGIEPEPYSRMETDEINAFLHERDAGMGLDDARASFERTFAEVVALLAAIDGSVLDAPFRPETDDRVLLDTVIGNTSEHYEEHIELLEPLVDSA